MVHGKDQSGTGFTSNVLREAVIGASVQAGDITGDVVSIVINARQPEYQAQLPLPLELPPTPATWVNREEDLARLHDDVAANPVHHGARIVVLSGPVGVGKSALGAHLGHHLQPHFPGGQLYVDLRGYDCERTRPTSDALGQLLRSVYEGPLPHGVEELAKRWRSVSAGRPPTCVLLDNAANAADVRPLLPGGHGHLVLITSRQPLAELAALGASLHPLAPLTPEDAHTYLGSCVGAARLHAEPALAQQLIHASGGVPLALTLIAAQLAQHPTRSLAIAVPPPPASSPHTTTCTPAHSPGALIVSQLDTIYATLPPQHRQVCRAVALLPVYDADVSLVTAVCPTMTPADAASALDTLAQANLLEATESTIRERVYRFPSSDIRTHARAHATDAERLDTLRRAWAWAQAATAAADELITPSHALPMPPLPHPPAYPVHFADQHNAMAWLKEQSHNLIELARTAAQTQEHAAAWSLIYNLWPWWRSDRNYDTWLELHERALDAARQCREPRAEIRLLNTIGIAQRATGPVDAALDTFNEVRLMARSIDDAWMHAQALHDLGATHLQAEHYPVAAPLLRKARQVRVHLGYARGVALTDILLAQAEGHSGQFSQATTRLTHARAALVAVPDLLDAARALAWRGRIHSLAGDIKAAEADLHAAHEEFSAQHAPLWQARTLEWLGYAAEQAGRYGDATTHFAQALARYVPVSSTDAQRVRQALAAVATHTREDTEPAVRPACSRTTPTTDTVRGGDGQ